MHDAKLINFRTLIYWTTYKLNACELSKDLINVVREKLHVCVWVRVWRQQEEEEGSVARVRRDMWRQVVPLPYLHGSDLPYPSHCPATTPTAATPTAATTTAAAAMESRHCNRGLNNGWSGDGCSWLGLNGGVWGSRIVSVTTSAEASKPVMWGFSALLHAVQIQRRCPPKVFEAKKWGAPE